MSAPEVSSSVLGECQQMARAVPVRRAFLRRLSSPVPKWAPAERHVCVRCIVIVNACARRLGSWDGPEHAACGDDAWRRPPVPQGRSGKGWLGEGAGTKYAYRQEADKEGETVYEGFEGLDRVHCRALQGSKGGDPKTGGAGGGGRGASVGAAGPILHGGS